MSGPMKIFRRDTVKEDLGLLQRRLEDFDSTFSVRFLSQAYHSSLIVFHSSSLAYPL